MRFGAAIFLLCVFFIPYSLYSQSTISTQLQVPFEREFQFTASGTDSIFVVDSDVVYVDSVYLINNVTGVLPVRFAFDRDSKVVRLDKSPAAGIIVRIIGYTAPSFAQSRQYANRTPILITEIINERISIEKTTGFPREVLNNVESDLFKSGSLTRSFTLGSNRGLELKSGLNMQLRGNLGGNYQISAVLTDKNIPLQPEGNTRVINELDNIFIDISGSGLSSRFGDISIENTGTFFGNFSRKLSGVVLKSSVSGYKATISAATTEGQYRSQQFKGIEGLQGPYILTGTNGNRNVIVLAGTEKVYIDGNRMVRGEDYDYVIDYTSGQITFMRNRLITGDSRVTVDFQYDDGNYKKNFYHFNIEKQTAASGLTYSVSVSREIDVKEKPQIGEFSSEDLTFLSNAGDDPERALKPGIEFVGMGNGTYRKVNELGVEYYTYSDSADYKVFFSDVGERNGDYEFLRLGVYEYVGKNKGSFMPVLPLPLPNAHSLTNMALGYKDKSGTIDFKVEYGFSRYDGNTFSQLDDNDNTGNALALELSIAPSNLEINGKNLGSARLTAKYWKTQEAFRPIDRIKEVEFKRKWGIDESNDAGENVFELEIEYRPFGLFSIKPAFGTVKIGNDFESTRRSAHVQFMNESTKYFDFLMENISIGKPNGDSDWIRHKGSAQYTFKGFTPSLLYEYESRSGSSIFTTGQNFNDVAGKLQYKFSEKYSISGMYQVRNDKGFQDGALFKSSNRSKNYVFQAELNHGSRFYSRIYLLNRSRTYFSQKETVESNIADIKIQSQGFQGALKTRANFQLSDERIPLKELVYIRVEEGRGNYSRDDFTGEYFPDTDGNYEVRTFPTDKMRGVKKRKAGLWVDFDPSRIKGGKNRTKTLDFLRFSANLRYENSSRDNTTTTNSSITSNEPVNKVFSLNQNLYIFERKEKFNVRIQQNYREIVDNQYIARSESRRLMEYSVRFRSRVNKTTSLESTFSYNESRKNLTSLTLINNKITTLRNDFMITSVLNSNWRVFLKASGRRQEDKKGGLTKVRLYSMNPGFERAFLGSGRLTADVKWLQVKTNNRSYLPFDFADGNQPGNNFTWRLSMNYRSSQNFVTSFLYSGSNKRRYDKTIHNIRLELQVLF